MPPVLRLMIDRVSSSLVSPLGNIEDCDSPCLMEEDPQLARHLRQAETLLLIVETCPLTLLTIQPMDQGKR